MRETGIQLRCLIDRKHRKIYNFPGIPEECLENPASISGDRILPGFVLNTSKVW